MGLAVIGALGLGCDLLLPPKFKVTATAPVSEGALWDHLIFLASDSLYGRGAGTIHELEAARYIRDVFISDGLEPGATDYFQTFPLPDGPMAKAAGVTSETQSRNVLGALAGRGPRQGQWVVVGAHYDHLGWRPVEGHPDSIAIYNGADDNASGVAVMLELSRYLTHYFARGEGWLLDHRSLLFIAFGAEELGLLGSYYFTGHPTVPLDSIVAMVNLDMVGRLRENELTVLGAGTAALWKTLLAEANSDSLVLIYNDHYIGSSDQYPFYRKAIPVLFFFAGLHGDYHQPTDDVDLINLAGMVQVGNLALGIVDHLARRPELPVFLDLPLGKTIYPGIL